MLHGVDVHARYQAGLRASALAGVDFVITKATGGTSLVIDGWQAMLGGAELSGVYHYAREKGRAGSAAEEAANFIVQANKAPDAALFLDWEEPTSALGDTAWVLEWMRLVEAGTGRKPIFYTYHAVLKAHPELSTIKDAGYQLWYARYPYSTAVGWQKYDQPTTVPYWGKPLMWQYSSAGGIAGYTGALDLNIFYGDAADWQALSAHTRKEETMTTANEKRAGVIATGRSLLNSAVYSNAWIGATYALFKSRRAGDCSDFTCAVFEPHGYKLPGMSWQQASAGTEVARWSGARGGGIAAFNAIKAKLRPADIVCMALQGSSGISHVNLNVDGTTALDHGGPGRGPRVLRYDDRWLLGDATQWIVRRIIPDDKPGTATETITIDDLEEVIGEMKATHVIFEKNGAIGIANILAGTYQMMKTETQFKDRVTVLKQAGAKVVEWRHLRPNPNVSKPNAVDNLDAWGQKI